MHAGREPNNFVNLCLRLFYMYFKMELNLWYIGLQLIRSLVLPSMSTDVSANFAPSSTTTVQCVADRIYKGQPHQLSVCSRAGIIKCTVKQYTDRVPEYEYLVCVTVFQLLRIEEKQQ